jgi:hypothetical protein
VKVILFLLFAFVVASGAAAGTISSEQAISIAERTCGDLTKGFEQLPWHVKLYKGRWWVWKVDEGGEHVIQVVDAETAVPEDCQFIPCGETKTKNGMGCSTKRHTPSN